MLHDSHEEDKKIIYNQVDEAMNGLKKLFHSLHLGFKRNLSRHTQMYFYILYATI